MARKDSDHQKKSMSAMFRGRAIFKPLNTGRIDGRVACVREWVANIFFYTKNGATIMIDAGYNYARLREKMGWLDIDPATIKHILITHQDTDHVGALERDGYHLLDAAKLYIGRVEDRYLTGEVRRKVIFGLYTLPQVTIDNEKVLLDGGDVFWIGDIKVEVILVPGHTWGHMVYIWWTTHTSLQATPSGLGRMAGTASSTASQRTTSLLWSRLPGSRGCSASGVLRPR
jgi:glyoxylase-like metal-dependent hydrolase (beta-lactamase superfamily II)